MDSERTAALSEIARQIRVGVIEGTHAAKSGHPGGSLSIAELLAYLYWEEMNIDPNDPQKASVTSGLRVGTPAVTTRGFNEDDMREVAELIYLTASRYDEKKNEIIERVQALCDAHPIYE